MLAQGSGGRGGGNGRIAMRMARRYLGGASDRINGRRDAFHCCFAIPTTTTSSIAAAAHSCRSYVSTTTTGVTRDNNIFSQGCARLQQRKQQAQHPFVGVAIGSRFHYRTSRPITTASDLSCNNIDYNALLMVQDIISTPMTTAATILHREYNQRSLQRNFLPTTRTITGGVQHRQARRHCWYKHNNNNSNLISRRFRCYLTTKSSSATTTDTITATSVAGGEEDHDNRNDNNDDDDDDDDNNNNSSSSFHSPSQHQPRQQKYEDNWFRNYEALKEELEQHSGDESALTPTSQVWLGHQREAYQRKLKDIQSPWTEEREHLLRKLGLSLAPVQDHWNTRYKQLSAFVQRYKCFPDDYPIDGKELQQLYEKDRGGRLTVDDGGETNNNDENANFDYESLRRWCVQQRYSYNENKLSQDRILALEKLNFVWNMHEKFWERRYQQLQQFVDDHKCFPHEYRNRVIAAAAASNKKKKKKKKKKSRKKKNNNNNTDGNSDDPIIQSKEFQQLFSWCIVQRQQYRNYQKAVAPKEREQEQLEKQKKQQSEQQQQPPEDNNKKLRKKKTEADDVEDSSNNDDDVDNDDIDTGGTVLSEERIAKLNAIQFPWDVYEDAWMDRYFQLEEYYKTHGDCLLPEDYRPNPVLGKWVQYLRAQYRVYKKNSSKSYLTEERIRLLEAIEFAWNHKEARWLQHYNQFCEYVRVNGGANKMPSKKRHPKLYNWIRNQRGFFHRDKLPEHRIQLLKKIGFVF